MFATSPSVPSTSFVGRDAELASIAALLDDRQCRLLTLVGPGGIGKTRLALQSIAEQRESFRDGVYFISLTSISSPELIPSTIASALQIAFYDASDPRLQLASYLREKQMLLVLDNFEHLLNGVDLLTNILQAAPEVKLLVTSRERLNLLEEWALTVDGLAFPDEHSSTSASLESYSAVQLFVQRARQANTQFVLSGNLEAVKRICQQVEGMPLSLELAATWLRVMSCEQIAEHVGANYSFLTTPLRNVDERHRSLRTVFDQSWNLLLSAEQAVLMRLSVFCGGFNLEAAEQVTGATLPILLSLADKSLIRVKTDGRYDLHELLRQYAADKLTADQVSATADRHLAYFLNLVEEVEKHEFGRDHTLWFDRLEIELDNVRTALTWSLNGWAAESGLRIVAAMRSFWEYRGHMQEGLSWSEELLAMTRGFPSSLRAKALYRAGELAGQLYIFDRALTLCTEALDIARQINDKWLIAWTLSAVACWTEPVREANPTTVPMLEESLSLFREIDDPYGLSHALRRRAGVANALQDYLYAIALINEALTQARDVEDKQAIAWSLQILGDALLREGRNPATVAPLFDESLLLFREFKDRNGVTWSITLLGRIAQLAGDQSRAQALYEEAMTLMHETGSYMRNMYRYCLAGLGTLIELNGKLEVAARLFIAAKWDNWFDLPLYPAAEYDADLALLCTRVGASAWAKASAEVKTMSQNEIITYALHQVKQLKEPAKQVLVMTQQLEDPLSERELEILTLIADGASNSEIAQQLVIGMSTVKKHINHIFSKLDVESRTQALVRARSLNLL